MVRKISVRRHTRRLQSGRNVQVMRHQRTLPGERIIRKTFKTGRRRILQRGEDFRVLKIKGLIFKVQDKDYKGIQNIFKRCKALKILRDNIPYYPECRIIKTKDKDIMVTEFEGKTMTEQNLGIFTDLNNKQRKQLTDALVVLLDNGYVNNDVREDNISIDKEGNAIFIDVGYVEKIERREIRQYMKDYTQSLNTLYEAHIFTDMPLLAKAYLEWDKRHQGFDNDYRVTRVGGLYQDIKFEGIFNGMKIRVTRKELTKALGKKNFRFIPSKIEARRQDFSSIKTAKLTRTQVRRILKVVMQRRWQ